MAPRARDAVWPAAALALCAALAAGCPPEQSSCLIDCDGSGLGDGDGSGPCGDSGRAFFEANVHPILDDGVTGDACARCHSGVYQDASGAPDFLGSSVAGAYDALVSDPRFVGLAPGNSVLLTRGSHTGPAFSASQEGVVEEWLTIEADERFGDCSGGDEGPPPGDTCAEALAAFGACMALEDWIAAGMHLIAEQETELGACSTCHGSGVSGNYMTPPSSDASIQLGFDKIRKFPAIRNLVKCSVNAGTGAFEDIVPSYRWRDKGSAGEHPSYFLTDENLVALDAWFGLAHEKWKSGSCGP